MDLYSKYLRVKLGIIDCINGLPYKEIKYIHDHTFEEGLPIREKALHELLDFAHLNTIFYSQFKGYDLTKYPIMTKADLIAHYNEIRVEENKIPRQEGPVFIQRTSGSTGTPLAIPQDTRKRRRRAAELNYYVSILGYTPYEKMIHLRTWDNFSQKPQNFKKKFNIVPFDVKKLDNEHILSLCNLINEEKAVYIRGYASCFDKISKVAKEHHLTFPSLKLIVATSEALEDDVRTSVKMNLRCEIASQYSDEECGLLAQERVPTKEKDNPMYFNWSGYFFEFLQLDSDKPAEYGELARIVLTDLHNYAFPLIRYDTGDTCVISAPNEHSNGYPILLKLYGRKFDLTYSTNDEPVYPLTYGRILKNYDCISSWQFVQKTRTDYTLILVLKDKCDTSKVPDMLYNIKQVIGIDANINVEIVDEIPLMRSGKRKPVRNEWNR